MKIVNLYKHKEYTISEDGTITNKITGKVYKHSLNKEGYKVVTIKYQQHLVHRLLLLSFKLSTHLNIKQQRGEIVKKLSAQYKVSMSVIHRIARREGRYANVI